MPSPQNSHRTNSEPAAEMGYLWGWCPVCGRRHRARSETPAVCCSCGYRGLVCPQEAQVTLSVNWEELRWLLNWAARYAARNRDQRWRVIEAVAQRLDRQVSARFRSRWGPLGVGDLAPGVRVVDSPGMDG